MTDCVACDEPATHVHQRHATALELEAIKANPDIRSVGPDETDALIAVYTCAKDAPPEEKAGLVHESHCSPPCTCHPESHLVVLG